MADEDNSYYSGKVEKYEDGKVLFRLDSKIGEFRRLNRGMKRNISFDDSDFYILSGIDAHNGDKIIVGNRYNIDRRELRKVAKMRKKEIEARGKKGKSLEEDLDLSEFIKDGEISGTGIATLLSAEDEKEQEEDV